MGKLKIILLTSFLMTLMLSFSSIHEYYVSIANINVNSTTNQLEIELKLDAEDFEKILSIERGMKVNFDEINEQEVKFIADYLSKHFSFWINGGISKIELVGEELNPDGDFWCYLVVELPDLVQSVKIKNDILLPNILQQHNIVNLKTLGKTQSHTFITKHTTHTFKIDAK